MSEFAKKVYVASALTAREVCKYDYVILNMMSSLELMPVILLSFTLIRKSFWKQGFSQKKQNFTYTGIARITLRRS